MEKKIPRKGLNKAERGPDGKENTGESTRKAGIIRARLLSAYDAGKRSLPWRGESDPYRIWVSEVMLQQTRVETVIPYYQAWLKRFPDLESLATAQEDEVLRAWQGLGYYSRARRLHEGARMVNEKYGGDFPRNSEALRRLPGIGEYTAGAVASIAFGETVPAVDGNVKRVLSRLFDLPAPTSADYRNLATELVDPDRPGDFNQALMELGATVCSPRSPRCEVCPLGSECLALQRGTETERPSPKVKKELPEVDIAVLVVFSRDESGGLRFLLRKRPGTGLLAGMWEFPGVEVTGRGKRREVGPPGSAEERESDPFLRSTASLAAELGLETTCPLVPLDTVIQVFSHLKARYRPYLTEGILIQRWECRPEAAQWVQEEHLSRIPLAVAQQKIAAAAQALTKVR